MEGQTIGQILAQELDKRFYVTQDDLTVDRMFRCTGIPSWTKALFSAHGMEILDQRIDALSSVRLLHAVSTYLLGIALREGIGLSAQSLPRIFSMSAAGGDAFYFFWSGLCLCHDLGFNYEENLDPVQQSKMLSRDGRMKLLDLNYDLLSLTRAEYPPELTCQEMDWIDEVLLLSNRYSRYRLEGAEEKYRRIDHGIAGASIFYDALKRQADVGAFGRPASGEMEVNAESSRFDACCLLIACAIARHNMWTVKAPADVDKYQRFGLHSLCAGPGLKRVDPKRPEEQMLFILDFMDTIDPVKNLYTRSVESEDADSGELERRRRFLLDQIYFSFGRAHDVDFRWMEFLPYWQVTISAECRTSEEHAWFDGYRSCIQGLSDWLATKEPDFYPDKAVCYYPRQPVHERVWPGGVTGKEIDSICLYGGSGVPGKAGRFYQLPNAYQTFNLLMMEGLDGERVRICAEGQRPDPIYIRDWPRTLEVFTDIFHAQCRYREHPQKPALPSVLYRADRTLNVERMRDLGKTFAFTSLSKAGILPCFAVRKENPALLAITVDSDCPCLDLADLLKEDYVYAQEAEILLPPFIRAEVSGGEALGEEQVEKLGLDGSKPVFGYQVHFGGFVSDISHEDPYVLIHNLEQNKETSAQVLEAACKYRDLGKIPADELRCYEDWKKSFSQLVYICFCRIWTDAAEASRKG